MPRTLRRILLVLATLALAWVVLALADLLPRLTATDRAAIAFMEEPWVPPAGADALPLLYRMSRLLPEADARLLAGLPAAEWPARARQSPQRQVEPLLERDNLPTLAAARGQEIALRASVQEHAAALSLVPELRAASHLSWPALVHGQPYPGPDALPDLRTVARLLRQQAALQWLDGDAPGAAAALCASTANWRRLLAANRSLHATMALSREADADARLLAELRARDADAAAQACPVLASPPQPALLCPALRGEYAQLVAYHDALAAASGWWERTSFDLGWHRDHARALQARALASWCEAPPTGVAGAGREAVDCNALGWAFDMVGCAIVPISMPAYAGYGARLSDHDAALRLAMLADWLRPAAAQGGEALAARFAQRPAELRGMDERLHVDAQGTWLQFTPKEPRWIPRGAPVPVLLHPPP